MEALTIRPVLTLAGRAALVAAFEAGNTIAIAEVVIGSGHYPIHDTSGIPLPEAQGRSALDSEAARAATSVVERIGSQQLSVLATIPAGDEVAVGEIGWILEDGTLFAVWSHPTDTYLYRTAMAELDIDYTFTIQDLPLDAIQVVIEEGRVPRLVQEQAQFRASLMALAEKYRGDALTILESRLQE